MKLSDFFFPPRCPFCKDILTGSSPVCQSCEKSLIYNDGRVCEICSLPIPQNAYRLCLLCQKEKRYFKRSFIPLIYEGAAQHAVISLKYYSHPSYAKAFAFLIADKILKEASPDLKFDFITFVPQSKKTFRERGYNQAELIAKELAKILKLPRKSTLIRTNDGKRQATLTAAERKKNVRKCYFPKEKELMGTVLLVDDVYTTGQTASYCSYLLKKSGCDEVYLATALIRV